MANKIFMGEINCCHPVSKFPYYHAKVKVVNNSNKDFFIDKLSANNIGVRDYLIFSGDDFIFEPVVKAQASSWLIVRADWETNDEISIKMEVVSRDSKERINLSRGARTPDYGGYWDKNWKYYFSIVLTERDGLQRVNEPIHITATVYADRINDPVKEVRVVKVDPETGDHKEIPSQVYGVAEPYQKIKDDTIQPSRTFDFAFFANLSPHSANTYLIFYGNSNSQAPRYNSDLIISGNRMDLSVENLFYKVNLHPKSGSIDEVHIKMGVNKKLEHKIETNGAIHWNPGIYSPPRAWIHTSDWDPPANYFKTDGPIFLIIQRWGQFPLYPETIVSQTYIFYSKCPFIRVYSTVEILEDLYVQALRNGEVVFNHDIAKEFALRDKFGEVKYFTITKLPRFEEIALTFDADTPWTAFYNSEHKVGFAQMTLNLANMRQGNGLVRLEHYNQYLNWGPWVYVTRDLIFPFGSQNPQKMTLLPKSCSYYEDMAFMPFIFKGSSNIKEKFSMVENSYRMLSNPLHIQVEYDTDHRVPATFVLGERLEGEVEETEEKPWPITLSREFTRFRQSPTLLNEVHFKKKDGKYYYR